MPRETVPVGTNVEIRFASGTTLTNKWDLQPTSASLRLLGPLAIPKVKSAVAENLRTLKQILENARR